MSRLKGLSRRCRRFPDQDSCNAAYGLYVNKKFFPQHSNWDEIWIFRGALDWFLSIT